MIHTIQKPQFSYSALEPYFDTATMELHTEKHHQAYADKLNATLDSYPDLAGKSLVELLSTLPSLPDAAQTPVKNFAGGVFNHNFFWSILSPKVDQTLPDSLQTLIDRDFGSFTAFQTMFNTKATGLFGSGWTWLVVTPDIATPTLKIVTTTNQDSVISEGLIPLLTLDLWEHSYYLKFQNRRPEYIEAFWHLVNWPQVNDLLENRLIAKYNS